MKGGGFPPLADVLRLNGLAGKREHPFPNDGWSGAAMTLLHRGSERFVLKRDSFKRDWIAQATADGPVLREAWFAAHGPRLPAPLRAPYLGVGQDEATFGILMPDLTGVLFDWDAPIGVEQLERVLGGLAELHGYPWIISGELAETALWCPIRERISLICRSSLERPGPNRDAVADRLLPGWDAWDRVATTGARDVIAALSDDPQPLIDALEAQPSTLIHGDLKLANVGIEPDGSIVLVDWQMVMVAPVAIELGWFLVSNVASLPLPTAEVIDRYRSKLAYSISEAEDDGRWVGGAELDEDGVNAAILVGLLLRGWRKGMDAEAGITLGSGISARDDLAWWCDRAVEAADRLL
ncbi:MAG: aminoglycoside phosphotransferase family protein [Chloroflexi bacterium]|nr:aminoglycoside phosphotransferase family protein [Chloroflexota bacterium]